MSTMITTKTPVGQKTIVEGSATMCYPEDQESTVFYNPVQVQNRDLSVLMITVAAEEKAIRQQIQQQRKKLKQAGIQGQELNEKLETFRDQLDVNQALKEQTNDQGLTILDALAASGLRSIRYWNEVPNVRHITINDLDPAAIDRAHTNITVNQLQDTLVDSNDDRPQGICIQYGDATHELYLSRRPPSAKIDQITKQQKEQWDIIDLDPYGSAAPFLDAAVQAVAHEGMLNVTCTDMAALGGSHPETCYGRYAAMPIQRSGYLQELALRILLQSIATTAAKYGRTIRPILSVGMNFYARVFVQVLDSKAQVNDLALNIGHVYQSTQCPTFFTLPNAQMGGKSNRVYQNVRTLKDMKCPETGAPLKIGGPLWLGPLHNQALVQRALSRLTSSTSTGFPDVKHLATKERLIGLLTSCVEELPDVPLYYRLCDLAETLRVSCPKRHEFCAALEHVGYRVSSYHKEPQAIKTDAPSGVVWDLLRLWVRQRGEMKTLPEGSAGFAILSQEPRLDVNFADFQTTKKKDDGIKRFPMNPESHWGPKKATSGYKKRSTDAASLPSRDDLDRNK